MLGSTAEWEFETERTRAVPWRSRGDDTLAAFLSEALTPAVTAELPPSWQGGVSRETAGEWIAARDAEGSVFLVEAREDGTPVGLFLFFGFDGATLAEGEVHVGYVLAESAWGKGLASEILQGFVQRWDEKGATAVLKAGVTSINKASQRVLEKAGFVKVSEEEDVLKYSRPRP
jgi:RimJ/RimL family protein N-acetyltransferase